MGIVIKQSAYASAINYVGVIIGAVNIMILFPMFLKPDEIGLYKAIFSMAAILAPFAQVGLARSTLRFFPRFNKSPKTGGRFLSLIFILGIFTITLFILLFQIVDDWVFTFFEEKAPEVKASLLGYYCISISNGLYSNFRSIL